MKNSILLILTILVSLSSTAQHHYKELIHQAYSLYKAKEFRKSAEKYSAAFVERGNKGLINDRYNAACSWALANEPDSSFVQLFKIAQKGNYSNYKHLTSDEDLKSLYKDDRWNEVIRIVKANKEEVEKNLDKPLVAILDSIYDEDQSYRLRSQEISKEHGFNSEESRAIWDTIRFKDSTNLVIITKLIDERGWLGADVVGQRGNSTLFLVIQHSNPETWEKYLPVMREAVKNGNANGRQLALLEDRAALARGERQIYGSQLIGFPDKPGYIVQPMIDPDNVDKRRAEVGLGTMQEYLDNWNMTWDVEEYKKNLLELENSKRR